MATLLRADNLAKSFSHRPLFHDVALSIDEGERLGLIGPNGSGKSTLLRIIAGLDDPDHGAFTRRRNLRAAYVAQHDHFPAEVSVVEAVEVALLSLLPEAHERHERAAMTLKRIGFARPDQPVSALSGGWRKRLAIARALATQPDLLLLDEPTNHLDLEGIEWLEETLRDSSFACITVTHDRFFLERLCTRIIELSQSYPQGTFSVDGGYDEFLRRREEFLHAQRQERQSLANQVRQDIKWLSRGAQARRTKAKGRIDDSFERMDRLEALNQRTSESRVAGVEFNATARRTRMLLRAKGIGKAIEGRTLFSNLDIELGPGACLGLLGPNGSGKTTLIRVLTGDLRPDAGVVERADNLRLATFSQHRESLDPREPLKDALCATGDTVHYRDRALHVATYAQKFLFRSEQLLSPVGQLSGGEQARVLLARLMLAPADLLVLDEPTNDLDIPTLEVLEAALEEFPGAIVLVTHDRFMLERLSTSVLALDGRGGAHTYADFFQWERARHLAPPPEAPFPLEANSRSSASRDREGAVGASSGTPSTAAPARKKLSYNDQREFDRMEQAIHEAESKVVALEAKVNDPAILADHRAMAAACAELEMAQAEVSRLYNRWAELEAKQA